MQKKHHFFFSFGCPNFRGGGGGRPGWDKRPNFSNASIWRLPLELMQLLSFTFTLFIFIFLCFSNHLFSQKWHMFENIYPMSKARMLLSKNLPQPTNKFTRIYLPYLRHYETLCSVCSIYSVCSVCQFSQISHNVKVCNILYSFHNF